MEIIESRYVTIEQAKLLKEKGFDEYCKKAYYMDSSENVGPVEDNIEIDWNKYKSERYIENKYFSRPEQWQVLEWLRVNHNIWIEVTMGKDHNKVWYDYDILSLIKPRKDDELGEEDTEYEENPNERALNYETTYDSLINEHLIPFGKISHNSPQEAYNAAFNHTLKYLI